MIKFTAYCLATVSVLASYEALAAAAWVQGSTSLTCNSNVGIGTSNPTYKLQVSGPTYLDDGTAQVNATTLSKFPASHYVTNGQTTSSALGVFGGGNFAGTTVVVGQEAAASSAWYHFKAVADSNGTPVTQFAIRGDGRVGIGTAAPSDALQVAGRVTAGREGFAGVYSSTQVQGIWSIGSAYKIDTVANSLGNQAGLAYAYTSSGLGVPNFGHQIMGVMNGTMTSSISLTNGNSYFQGKMGIGVLAPEYKLDVGGTARVNQLVYNSDRRLKTDIAPIEQPIEKLLALQGVTYHWNTLARERGIKDSRQQIGLIAQEVEGVFPEAVETAKDGFKSVNYPALVGPLVASVNELYYRWVEKSSAQDQAIAELQAQNADLRKRLEALEAKAR